MSIKFNAQLVSVIVAAYNEEKYILECIDSIINQTYKNIEIIVIDDGSTDNTLHLLKSYNDNRLEIVTHKNRGRVFSRNRALHLAIEDNAIEFDDEELMYLNRAKEFRYLDRGLLSENYDKSLRDIENEFGINYGYIYKTLSKTRKLILRDKYDEL